MKRRKVRAKRGSENRTKLSIQNRVHQAFENWTQILAVTREEDIEHRVNRFTPLRNLIAEVEAAALTFVELNYGCQILSRIETSTSNPDLQITYLFALSDLIDVDETGFIGRHFSRIGAAPIVLNILRSIEPRSPYESRYKTAGIRALSSLCLHDIDATTDLMDEREIQLINNILQVKSMIALHSRVITFINNLFVCGKFQELLSESVIPSLMTLLMFNVTNHIKSRKHFDVAPYEEEDLTENDQQKLSAQQQAENSPVQAKQSQVQLSSPTTGTSKLQSPSSGNSSDSVGADPTTNSSAVSAGSPVDHPQSPRTDGTDYEIDPMYDDHLYNEFIECTCYLLGNLTTSSQNCILAEKYSIIDIMTLLFHNTDTTLDALTSVIKCLGNLANLEENRAKLMESNIIPIAVKLIKLNIDDEMKAQITLLLANMAGYGNCTQTLIEGGVIEPMVDLLETDNADYQKFAALALANIAIHISAVPRIMHTKILKPLIDMCYLVTASPYNSSAVPSTLLSTSSTTSAQSLVGDNATGYTTTMPNSIPGKLEEVPYISEDYLNNNRYLQRQAIRIINSISTYPTGLYWNHLIEAGAIDALKHVIQIHKEYHTVSANSSTISINTNIVPTSGNTSCASSDSLSGSSSVVPTSGSSTSTSSSTISTSTSTTSSNIILNSQSPNSMSSSSTSTTSSNASLNSATSNSQSSTSQSSTSPNSVSPILPNSTSSNNTSTSDFAHSMVSSSSVSIVNHWKDLSRPSTLDLALSSLSYIEGRATIVVPINSKRVTNSVIGTNGNLTSGANGSANGNVNAIGNGNESGNSTSTTTVSVNNNNGNKTEKKSEPETNGESKKNTKRKKSGDTETGNLPKSNVQSQADIATMEKNKGNEMFSQKKFKDAIICYSKALFLDPQNHTLYSNRAAAYMHIGQYELALKDSEKCVLLAPADFVKAHFRLGKALLGLEQYDEAVQALTTALKMKRNNKEIREALQHALIKKKDHTSATTVPHAYQKLNGVQILDQLYELLASLDGAKPGTPLKTNNSTNIGNNNSSINSTNTNSPSTASSNSSTNSSTISNGNSISTNNNATLNLVHHSPNHIHNLLLHLFTLLKRYYCIDLDDDSRLELMGIDADSIGSSLQDWSIRVDLNSLLEQSGIPQILFETELIANHIKNRTHHQQQSLLEFDQQSQDQDFLDGNGSGNTDGNGTETGETTQSSTSGNSTSSAVAIGNSNGDDGSYYEDLSSYQFSFFVTTILARLVIQGHTKFGLRALKRLIVMDSNKWVRDSVGSPLTRAIVQVSGYGEGLWGLPKMPTLRHLFVHYGGLRCVALDCKDDPSFKKVCVNILHETSLQEWKKQSQNILEIVLSNFVVPSLKPSTSDSKKKEEIRRKSIEVFGKIYSIPQVRVESFDQWAKQTEKEDFSAFCRFISMKSKSLLKKEKLRNLSDQETGEKLAKLWYALPLKDRSKR